MKPEVNTRFIISIVLLIACLLYLYFTNSFEGATSTSSWNTKIFTALTEGKEIGGGKAINPINNKVKLSGFLPGQQVGKPSDCLIVNNSLEFSPSVSGKPYANTSTKDSKTVCGQPQPFTSTNPIPNDNKLTCTFNNNYTSTNFKGICHADGKDNSGPNFYKVSSS